MSASELLPLDRIATEGTQARVALSETIIHEYAEALQQGDTFPPIDVYFDDTTYWLADGFHRVRAAKEAGRNAFAATIHQGGRREALLHALSANETHGYRRTADDRRHAVQILLADPEWQKWNNSEVARRCRVSEHLVRTVRQELEPAEETKEPPERTRQVTRGGKTFTMRTGGIGSATRARAKVPAAPAPPAPAPAPTPSQALPGSPEPHPETPAVASSTESKIDTPTPPAPDMRYEESPSVPTLPPQTEAPAPPSLTEVWQQASEDERKAFVAAHLDDLRILIAAHEKPQPKKHPTPSPRTARSQPQQPKRKRPAASKRA